MLLHLVPSVSVIGSLGTFPSSAPSQVTFSNPPSLAISMARRAILNLSFSVYSELTFIGVNRLNAAEKNCLQIMKEKFSHFLAKCVVREDVPLRVAYGIGSDTPHEVNGLVFRHLFNGNFAFSNSIDEHGSTGTCCHVSTL